MLSDRCYAVIMAGGAGTRLWPLSTSETPKHFLKLFGGRSLIEMTVDKLAGLIPDERIVIQTSAGYRELARRTFTRIPPENFVFEPCLRDTAAAIGLAATVLRTRCAEATMVVLTADQIIEPADRFNAAVSSAVAFLEKHPDRLVAFGVEAASPSTLVGWQKLGERVDFPGCDVRRIAAFTEKPESAVAQRYMSEGGYCWNSGQFAWKADTILEEIATHLPEASSLLAQIGKAWNTPARDKVLGEAFPKMPRGSIDYKVMQKTANACSVILPCTWEDMGTHAALLDRVGKKQEDNRVVGKTLVVGSGNRVLADTDQVVVVATDGVTVIVTDKAVFVGGPGADMKALVERTARQWPEVT
jgi:mannose-1-phosphate guanylyltransferase